jgi:glyoxylase-like metal-dependent hydrolase (beta-lactamase superfamily II)
VSGREKSLRLQQAEAIYATLPDDQKPEAKAFEDRLKAIQPVKVDTVFTDGEEPSFLSGVQIIHTPGHMPGHISLYLKESNTLLAADALVCQDGQLEIANPAFTIDMSQAIGSVRKLQQLDIEKIICYHGGVVDVDIPSKLDQLLAKYS